jgi:hypothetical protein
LTGERPFPEGVKLHDAALPARYPQLVEAPRLPRTLPAALVRVVEACLQKNPRGRPQSAAAVARALDPFTAVKVWPAALTGKFEPFESSETLTRLRRLRP